MPAIRQRKKQACCLLDGCLDLGYRKVLAVAVLTWFSVPSSLRLTKPLVRSGLVRDVPPIRVVNAKISWHTLKGRVFRVTVLNAHGHAEAERLWAMGGAAVEGHG